MRGGSTLREKFGYTPRVGVVSVEFGGCSRYTAESSDANATKCEDYKSASDFIKWFEIR